MVHDENNDVRLLSRIAKINPATKTISIPMHQQIGNKRWGRIDFLTRYRGYHLVRPDGTIMSNSPAAEERRKKRTKEEKREEVYNRKRKDKASRR